MRSLTLLNVLFNVLLAAVFVALNMQSVAAGYDEQPVALALFYGLITIAGNGIFVAYARR